MKVILNKSVVRTKLHIYVFINCVDTIKCRIASVMLSSFIKS
jgi:hypothetical protein